MRVLVINITSFNFDRIAKKINKYMYEKFILNK